MKNVIYLGIFFGLIHWGLSAVSASALPQCNENSRSYNAARCDCLKSAIRSSLIAERVFIAEAFFEENSSYHQRMRRDMQKIMRPCF
ncbi:MAG: hypothetical protein AAGM84_13200 [Pseudomonadota bacterium]